MCNANPRAMIPAGGGCMVMRLRTSLPIAGIVLLASCASVPTQTKAMAEQGATVSSEAIRVRLRSEAVPFTGLMAHAADEAATAATDPGERRSALIWKIGVVPALYRTLFNQRPLIAILDTWALLVQMEMYLESSEGHADLGPGAVMVLATTKDLQGRVREIARWAVPDKDLSRVDAKVRAWAQAHPVGLSLASRDSIEPYLVSLAPAEELSAFAVVGLMSEDLAGLASRMDFLPFMLPNQFTWQAELAYIDLVDPRLDVVLSRGAQAFQQIDAMLAWLGTTGLEGFAEEQRIQIMRAVSEQRTGIEATLDRQREELEAFVRKERAEIAARVTRERVAAMEDAQRFTDRATSDGARRATEMADHVLAWVAILLGAAFVVGLAVTWVARRGRPSRPSSA